MFIVDASSSVRDSHVLVTNDVENYCLLSLLSPSSCLTLWKDKYQIDSCRNCNECLSADLGIWFYTFRGKQYLKERKIKYDE